jgi:hypothetical protein
VQKERKKKERKKERKKEKCLLMLRIFKWPADFKQ